LFLSVDFSQEAPMSTSDAALPSIAAGEPPIDAAPHGDVRLVLRAVIEAAQLGLGRLEAIVDDDAAWTRLASTMNAVTVSAGPALHFMANEVLSVFRDAESSAPTERADSHRADSDRADSERADSDRADSHRADSNRADSDRAQGNPPSSTKKANHRPRGPHTRTEVQ
jgi:hypothetical protein